MRRAMWRSTVAWNSRVRSTGGQGGCPAAGRQAMRQGMSAWRWRRPGPTWVVGRRRRVRGSSSAYKITLSHQAQLVLGSHRGERCPDTLLEGVHGASMASSLAHASKDWSATCRITPILCGAHCRMQTNPTLVGSRNCHVQCSQCSSGCSIPQVPNETGLAEMTLHFRATIDVIPSRLNTLHAQAI